MRYLTTRGEDRRFEASMPLGVERYLDGALFTPESWPFYGEHALGDLMEKSYWDIAAEILNLFFPTQLTGWDLGVQDPAEPLFLGHKLAVFELWHRQKGDFRGMQKVLCEKVGSTVFAPDSWPVLAVHVAILFALYGALCQKHWIEVGEPLDLAVAAGEFTFPAAAVYARKMGLPLGVTVCVCNENNKLWELIHRGETRLDARTQATDLPLLDIAVPANLERVLSFLFGREAATEFGALRENHRSLYLDRDQQKLLRRLFSVPVVGSRRTLRQLPRIYSTLQYLMSPYTALTYTGLMDHRSLEGDGAATLLLAEESPVRWAEAVLAAMDAPAENRAAQIQRLERLASEKRRRD